MNYMKVQFVMIIHFSSHFSLILKIEFYLILFCVKSCVSICFNIVNFRDNKYSFFLHIFMLKSLHNSFEPIGKILKNADFYVQNYV